MAYKGLNTIFGAKTTSDISSLTGMTQGDTVFNTEYGMVEVYTGNVWTNNCSIVITAGATIATGQLVYINASGQAVLLNNSAANYAKGIGVCQYGGTSGSLISVRTHGLAKCLTSASVSLGDYATVSSTAGSIGSTTSPTAGTLGRIVQGTGAASLAYVMLTFIERG